MAEIEGIFWRHFQSPNVRGQHSFHLPGHFLAKEVLDVSQEKCQEKHFTRKLKGNLTKCQESVRKFGLLEPLTNFSSFFLTDSYLFSPKHTLRILISKFATILFTILQNICML